MSSWLRDYRLFWQQFRQQFHSTGAVLPSGRLLSKALARFVGQGSTPQRILEVGPGTGAVTAQIVRRLGQHDSLDMVELNDAFVCRLRERFEHEEPFCQAAARARVLHQGVEELAGGPPYDLVISGLPLNNFAAADVEHLLTVMTGLVRPGGTLSFFEYIAIRPARSLVSSAKERERLRGIGEALARVLGPHEFRRDWVLPNVPPAWVHHVRPRGEAASAGL